MKIFTLNDSVVRAIRRDHPMLQGRKLIASGQFSGVFEGDSPETVLKLSIDHASYAFHFDPKLKVQSQHFAKGVCDYGMVGLFVTSRNVTRTALSNPIELKVPIYLYEVEKLEKIPHSTENRSLSMQLTKDWRKYDMASPEELLNDRAKWIVNKLREKGTYTDNILDSLSEVVNFMYDYEASGDNSRAFVDLHGMNFMQRQDGTFVFSDPVGDLRIYKAHYTFRGVDSTELKVA